MMKLTTKKLSSILALFVAFGVFLVGVAAIEPNGADVTVISSESSVAGTPGNASAQAGNISKISLFSYAETQSWQGYAGNLTGTVELADAGGNVLYNWTQADFSGEVFASTNASITWTSIQCFNFTANGTLVSTGEVAGNISLAGTNLTQLEAQFNIASDDVDGVNETFTFTGAGTHDAFFVANLEFTEGECLSTRVFTDSGPTSNEFEQVLLYEPVTTSVVFAALLESNVVGYDAGTYDFQMLVLEDGHNDDIATTTYYFFAEIE